MQRIIYTIMGFYLLATRPNNYKHHYSKAFIANKILRAEYRLHWL